MRVRAYSSVEDVQHVLYIADERDGAGPIRYGSLAPVNENDQRLHRARGDNSRLNRENTLHIKLIGKPMRTKHRRHRDPLIVFKYIFFAFAVQLWYLFIFGKKFLISHKKMIRYEREVFALFSSFSHSMDVWYDLITERLITRCHISHHLLPCNLHALRTRYLPGWHTRGQVWGRIP